MKILVIGPAWVGDMVMSQALYITLKQQHPDAIIDVIAPNWCKPILERMPEVNKAITMPIGHGELNLFGRRAIGRSLKDERYDQAIITPNSAKSALIPWFAKIAKRTGWKGEMRYGLLNDLRANKRDFTYMVERYVALAYPKKAMENSASLGGLSSLPKPNLTVDNQAQLRALEKYALTTFQGKFVGLCPGAEFGPAKKWPNHHYAAVAQSLVEKGQHILLFGSQKDLETCEAICSLVNEEYQAQLHVLAGKTALIEAVDLLAACHSVVSNDSGLMHVAASVGCNVIAIYGSTSPEYTPPLSDSVEIVHTDISCRPCFKRECPLGHLKCLTELAPEKVIAAIQRLSRQH